MPKYYNRGWKRNFFKTSTYSKQKSGNRYFNISFPVETVLSLTVAANQSFSNVLRTVPYMARVGTAATDANVAGYAAALVDSKAYRIYAGLYDSVKINSVQLKFSIATTIGEGGIPGIRCYTSWDRDLMATDGIMSEDDLLNGPESQVVTFINNSRCKFSRYNRAQDLQERTTYHDCTTVYAANDYRGDAYWVSPNLATGRSVGYCPSLSMVIQCSDTKTSTRTITLQVQGVYNVTFRNPKYGLSASAPSKMSDEIREVLGEAVELDEEKKEVEETRTEEPVLKKKKVVYEEEMIPDDEEEEDDEESQAPLTQPFKSPMKKAGKKTQ